MSLLFSEGWGHFKNLYTEYHFVGGPMDGEKQAVPPGEWYVEVHTFDQLPQEVMAKPKLPAEPIEGINRGRYEKVGNLMIWRGDLSK